MRYYHILKDFRRIVGVGVMCSILTACGDDIPSSPPANLHTLLHRLMIEPRGLTMAVGETFQLVPTATDLLGEKIFIPDSLPVQYHTEYLEQITVSASGLVTAISSTPSDPRPAPVSVVATWTYQGVTRKDTIYIAVTETRPPYLAGSLSVQPASYPKDSTWTGAGYGLRFLPATVLSTTGDTMTSVYVYMWTDRREEQLVEFVDPVTHFFIPAIYPGVRIWVHGSATIYGVSVRDSVLYTIIDPPYMNVTVRTEMDYVSIKQSSQIVSPCAAILFTNYLTENIRIEWDPPTITTTCVSEDETGNITSLQPGKTAIRKIQTSGTYGWSVIRANGSAFVPAVHGSIQVRDRSEL